jgi:hypothetical protein
VNLGQQQFFMFKFYTSFIYLCIQPLLLTCIFVTCVEVFINNILLNIASITQSSNKAAHTLLVNINWQFILLFNKSFYCLVLDIYWFCCHMLFYIYVKQSWLLNVNAPLGTWFGKKKNYIFKKKNYNYYCTC